MYYEHYLKQTRQPDAYILMLEEWRIEEAARKAERKGCVHGLLQRMRSRLPI
jgi:hypothetical protein